MKARSPSHHRPGTGGILRIVPDDYASLPQFGHAHKNRAAPSYSSGCACPQCASVQWWRGRASAECARCGEVLPL